MSGTLDPRRVEREILRLPCPYCGASPRKPCRSFPKGTVLRRAHRARRNLYWDRRLAGGL